MTSRKDRPSFTSSSDLAWLMPMLVPRPPFSLITTRPVERRARAVGVVGQLLGVGQRLHRLDLRLGQRALLARLEARALAGERLDRDLGQALGPHLLHGALHERDPMRLNAFAGSTDTWLDPAKEDPISASPTDATTAAALAALRRMSFAVVDARRSVTRSTAPLRRSCFGVFGVDAVHVCEVDGRHAGPRHGLRPAPDGSVPAASSTVIPFDRPTGVGRVFETGEPLNVTDAANSRWSPAS